MSDMRWWRRGRRVDESAAVVVGVGNLLLSSALSWMLIGGGPFFEATTRAEETAAQEFAVSVFGCWLAAGLVLFLVLGMMRTLVGHVLAMLLPPAALVLVLLAL
ncbi:hypothetical protein ABZZ17_34605 [Streptomyces sp. NPDC006512]|uniref:hypothetical protein n=1 Tax=Streptomyces sp. NPDC006512 TaxID=3154307 RepID=UPI0033A0F1BA